MSTTSELSPPNGIPSVPARGWRGLGAPLNLTGYFLIGLIAVNQLEPGRIAEAARYAACAATLGVFLAAFIVRELLDHRARWANLAILVQLLAALGNLQQVFDGFNPVLLVLVAAQLPERTSPLRAAILLLAADLCLLWMVQEVHEQPRAVFTTLVYASFQLFAWFTAHFAFSAERGKEELVAVNAHLLATRALLAEGARNGERLRLSRELHDVAGHALTGLKLHLELALRLPDEAQRRQRLEAASALLDGLLEDIRGVVGQLRRHDGIPLIDLLTITCRGFPGVEVDLQIAPELQVDDVGRAETLLRVVQEALTNAVRHGHARRVRVALEQHAAHIELRIEDDGRGSASLREGHGLTGMRERLADHDGQLHVDITPGRGLRLRAVLPLPQGPAA